MIIFKNPEREHNYRMRTQTDTAIAGVTAPSFICRRCKQPRVIAGRKKHAIGWACKGCSTELIAIRQNKAKENTHAL